MPNPPAQRDNWTFGVQPDRAPRIHARRGVHRLRYGQKEARRNGGGKYRATLGYGKQYFTNPRNQRVITRAPISMNGTGKSWYKHGAYLQREGAQQDGRGLGFDAEGNAIRIPTTVARWQREGDRCLFRIMLSPEHGDRIDLQTFTQATMRSVEKDLGKPLEWVAIDHHNTAHDHVHVCMRGVDREGHELRIAQDYLYRGIAARASDLLTRELGWRLEPELEQARERALERLLFGEHDRSILMKLDDRQQVQERDLTDIERRRLLILEERRLAWKHDEVWEVAYQWKGKMTMAETNDREQRKQERELEREHAREQERERSKEELTKNTPEQQRTRLVRTIDEMEREQSRERGR